MRQAEKFKSGETLKNDIGPKLNLIVDRVNREIRGDGRTIIVSELGNVITIKAIHRPSGGGSGGGASEYAGTFKLAVGDNAAVKVINGALTTSAYCGLVSVGGQTINVPVFSGAVTASGYVILTVDYEFVGDATTPTYKATISTVTSSPADYLNGSWRKIIVLGQYTYTAASGDTAASVAVSQSWLTGNVYVTDRVV